MPLDKLGTEKRTIKSIQHIIHRSCNSPRFTWILDSRLLPHATQLWAIFASDQVIRKL